MVVVLFAAWRLLTPFSTGIGRQRETCGVVAAEASKGPTVKHDAVILSPAALVERDADQQTRTRDLAYNAQAYIDNATTRRPSYNTYGGLTYGGIPRAEVPVPPLKPDTAYDHTTVSTFTLTACASAARRKATTVGVLAALALVGTAGAFLVLRDPARPQGPTAEPVAA